METRSNHAARLGLAIGIAAAGCLAVLPASASALVVSSDENGLQLREPDNILNRVKLSVVDSGGLKYRVEMAQFGGRGIGFGSGCTQISTQQGVDVALCERINPVVSQVSFGPMRDQLEVDPAFPDPIHVRDGGLGPDRFTLGAGADVSEAAREDTVFGEAGDDTLTSTGGRVDGGEGNDKLHLLGRAGVLNGGPGDDTLTADPAGSGIITGGEGTDSFDGGGARVQIDSRDGVSEQVTCGEAPGGAKGVAVIDLVDAPSDAELLEGGCVSVDRAPKGEKTAAQLASKSLKLGDGTAAVKVRCTTGATCKGKVSLTVKGRTTSESYSIKGKRTATVRVAARAGKAVVRISEKGKRGPRTVQASATVKR